MKRLLLFFILACLPSQASKYDFLHYQTNYNKAIELALKENKNIMLFVVQDSCPWCYRLARKSLQDSTIKDKIQSNYIPVILNSDCDTLPLAYQTKAYPTLFFINAKEDEEIYRAVGYQNKGELQALLLRALQSYKEDLADQSE